RSGTNGGLRTPAMSSSFPVYSFFRTSVRPDIPSLPTSWVAGSLPVSCSRRSPDDVLKRSAYEWHVNASEATAERSLRTVPFTRSAPHNAAYTRPGPKDGPPFGAARLIIRRYVRRPV